MSHWLNVYRAESAFYRSIPTRRCRTTTSPKSGASSCSSRGMPSTVAVSWFRSKQCLKARRRIHRDLCTSPLEGRVNSLAQNDSIDGGVQGNDPEIEVILDSGVGDTRLTVASFSRQPPGKLDRRPAPAAACLQARRERSRYRPMALRVDIANVDLNGTPSAVQRPQQGIRTPS
jgi:hypothetical protein